MQEPMASMRQTATIGRTLGNYWIGALLRRMFLTTGRSLPLLALSIALITPAIWAILSPAVIFSREMTWDLMYNLDGAWRLYSGQTAHVDFHDPLGTLPFAVTALGFYVVGIKPFAFLIGETIVAIFTTALAFIAVRGRLTLVPGALFIALCAMLALMPLVFGDLPTEYTFAMGYNRFGWSLLGILYAILFIEPRDGRQSVLADTLVAVIVMLALYFIKITYFGVACGAVALAIWISRHIRMNHWPWCIALALVALIAVAPANHGYIADIVDAISTGSVRTHACLYVRNFAYSSAEQSTVIAAILVLFYLWLRERIGFGTLVAGGFAFASGLFLISQNAQDQGIPLYVIPTLLILVAVCDWASEARGDQSTHAIALVGAAACPLFLLVFYVYVAVFGYNLKTRQMTDIFVVADTNLQGMAVPLDTDNVIDEFATGHYSSTLFGRLRAHRVRYELSQYEYIEAVLELANSLRAHGAVDSAVLVIDQVNPLPFAMGSRAPRRGNLWWAQEIPWRSPEDAFAETDYVAIPHFPTKAAVVQDALTRYQRFLSAEFAASFETRYWTVLKRLNPVPVSSD